MVCDLNINTNHTYDANRLTTDQQIFPPLEPKHLLVENIGKIAVNAPLYSLYEVNKSDHCATIKPITSTYLSTF